jgi:AraC family transcriptional regulator of adaptative response/methylated-DNA-[protein]-cysteine methyltransferase
MSAITSKIRAPLSFEDDADRWAAVQRRDPAADGRFVYSVSTTRVYCRPSCPSRPARRTNVAFHDDPAAAEAAGFRACKRCKPDAPSQAQQRAQTVAEACRLIEAAAEPPSLAALARAANMSRFHFHRIFKDITGVTPKAYTAARRAERLRGELAAGTTVTEAIYGAGYNASSRFYEESAERLGMRPSQYRGGGRGARIKFALGECSLGSILVAATSKGVCAIEFGDDADALIRNLQDRFPRAELIGGDADFERTIALVVAQVESPRGHLDLPLDVRGTAFQQRVWGALGSSPSRSQPARPCSSDRCR